MGARVVPIPGLTRKFPMYHPAAKIVKRQTRPCPERSASASRLRPRESRPHPLSVFSAPAGIFSAPGANLQGSAAAAPPQAQARRPGP